MKSKSRRTDTATVELGPGSETGPPSRIPDWAILLFFLLLVLAQTVLSVREKSATFDETAHLPAGYIYWRLGDYGMNAEHPPFVKMLAAFPLLFVDVKMTLLPVQPGADEDFFYGHELLYVANDADRLLFLGRMAVLPLTLLLGTGVFLWTKELFGRGAAIFAILLYSFEPNLLAHAPLVNTDLATACFMFLAVYAFYRLIQEVSIPRLVFAGVSVGLALITKFSTLPLLPILLVLGLGAVFAQHSIRVRLPGISRDQAASRAAKMVVLLVAALVLGVLAYGLIWAAYQFRYEGLLPSGGRNPFPWDRFPHRAVITDAIAFLRGMHLLPEAYLYGLAFIFTKLNRVSFLMGQISKGWWYYFIVTFLLKTPVAFLLLTAAAPLGLRRLWRDNRLAVLFLAVPVLIYFGIASAGRLNIGHRHILPLYPFLIVMASALVPWVTGRGTAAKAALAVLSVWYIVSSLTIFPHYLAYFNELAGGPDQGYKYLVDSNLDWGQDLKGLKRYMEVHKIQRVWLSYFGTASPDYYGITHNSLPSYVDYNVNTDDVRTPFVAISATNLQGVYFPVVLGLDADFFKDFRARQPIAKIGYSIFIYRLK